MKEEKSSVLVTPPKKLYIRWREKSNGTSFNAWVVQQMEIFVDGEAYINKLENQLNYKKLEYNNTVCHNESINNVISENKKIKIESQEMADEVFNTIKEWHSAWIRVKNEGNRFREEWLVQQKNKVMERYNITPEQFAAVMYGKKLDVDKSKEGEV